MDQLFVYSDFFNISLVISAVSYDVSEIWTSLHLGHICVAVDFLRDERVAGAVFLCEGERRVWTFAVGCADM